MKGYVINIENATLENDNYRKVLYTGKSSQLVLMTIQPGDEIGSEKHDLDQFILNEAGQAVVTLDGVNHAHEDDWAVVIPAGTVHNVLNNGDVPLLLYSIYSPPEHKDCTLHPTKAEDREEHFDGVTTE